MYYMKWFKSPSDKYDDPRMKRLRSIKNGNTYALIYDMLNALAARCNMNGVVAFDETTPYCAEELGIVLGFDEATTFDALEMLIYCKFIERKDGFIKILDWEKEQFDEWKEDKVMKSILDKKNEKKEKKQKKEKKEKENIKQEQEQEQEQKQEQSTAVAVERDCTEVQSLYSNICRSYPKIEILSESQMTAIGKLVEQIPMDKIKLCFERAEESDYLKSNGWANFDWLIKVENAIKVLNGNYRNDTRIEDLDGTMKSFDTDEFIEAALSRGYEEFN